MGTLGKLGATVGKLVVDGTRSVEEVSGVFQMIVDGNMTDAMSRAQEASDNVFELQSDLGIMTVPRSYCHNGQTIYACEAYPSRIKGHHPEFYNRESFLKPSRIMLPGEKYHVQVFKQRRIEQTTAEAHLAFLKRLGGVHLGAQGMTLVIELKWELLRGGWYASFDKPNRLVQVKQETWSDSLPMVPGINVLPGGVCALELIPFNHGWGIGHSFFCFTEVE